MISWEVFFPDRARAAARDGGTVLLNPTNGASFRGTLVQTQQVLNHKHLGWSALRATAGIAARHLANGQTNFVKMLWKFGSVYNAKRQYGDHFKPVTYAMQPPPAVSSVRPRARDLFIHMQASDTPHERIMESIRLFGTHVIPEHR